MTRVYAYRIEGLTAARHDRLESLFLHLGWLRNQTVAYCRDQYAEDQKTPSFYDLCKWLTCQRSSDQRTDQWNVACQRSVLQRVRRGYDKFFRDYKGLPRFRPIDGGVHSFETEKAKPRRRKQGGYYVQIKGIGRLSFTDRRNVLDTATVKIVRVVRTPLRYEIQLVCDVDKGLKAVDKRDVVGVDLGVKAAVTLSNGVQYAPFIADDTRRKRLQRRVARAQRGSNGRKKAKASLAKESRRIAVRRRNAIHRMTTAIVKRHSANLAIEDLKLQNMTAAGGSRKRGLNRAILSQSLGTIATQLVYKAESAGGQCVTVAPHYTTQTCSHCLSLPREKVTLSQRIYECEHCGYASDRDVNAARNVRRKGLESFQRVGLSSAGQAKEDTPVRPESDSSLKGADMTPNRSGYYRI